MQEIKLELQSEENTETTYWVEVEGKHYVFDESLGGYLII